MKKPVLIELSYEVIANGENIPREKWNNIFQRLMELNNVHSVKAIPSGKNIELTVNYNCIEEKCSDVINRLEETIKDEAYKMLFIHAEYAKRE
jgi:hypothetical protein